jgi:phosphohistidine swiveling domain-containing protein
MKFNKDEWVRIGQWVQPTLSESFWDNWTQSNKKYPFDIPQLDGRLFIFHGHHFVRKADIEIIRRYIKDNCSNHQFLDLLTTWIENIHQECITKIASPQQDVTEKLKTLEDLGDNNVNAWIFCLVLNDILEDEIKEICTKENHNFEKVLESIKPLKESFAVQQLKDAQKLHNKLHERGIITNDIKTIEENFPELAQEIQKHVKKFEFVGVHHFVGQPYSIESFFEMKTNNLPHELSWYLKLSSIAAWGRTHMAETSGYMQHKIKPTLEEINNILSLNENDYIWLSAQELIKATSNKDSFCIPNIERRKVKVGTYSEGAKTIIIDSDDVDTVLETMLPEPENYHFPLNGNPASKGKVTGRAKIVIRPEDLSKVNEGDILVAPETSPDFIVGLKKAAGVITSQGGITSHAAIVSREFGIPCIVGVKGATDVIQDNDLIEVDAIHGVVKKLES